MIFKKCLLGISILLLSDLGLQGIFDLRILERLLINTPFIFTIIQSLGLFCAMMLLLMLFEKE